MKRFGLIVDAEWSRRKNHHLTRLIKQATLRYPGACVGDIEYHADRQLDKSLILRLSTCNYIEEHRNIICMGASGADAILDGIVHNSFKITIQGNDSMRKRKGLSI